MAFGRKQGLSHAWMTRIVVLTMALRALLPVGYIPSVEALQDGRFELIICTSAGPVTVDGRDLPGVGGHDGPADGADAYDGSCPFAASAPVALIPPLLAPWIAFVAVRVAPRSAEGPVHPSRNFSPAHPRAPPLSA